jgi:hypothetical protein
MRLEILCVVFVCFALCKWNASSPETYLKVTVCLFSAFTLLELIPKTGQLFPIMELFPVK